MPGKPPAVLRLVLSISETSAPHNQFALALSNRYDITICSYFRANIPVPQSLTLFEGDGSLRGFFRALKAALDHKSYDIIHSHSPHVGFLFLVTSVSMQRKTTHPTVHTVHSSYPNYKFRNRLMLIPVFALFRRIVFCSHSSLESFPKFFRRLADDRACVVQNGVDLARIDRAIENSPKRLQSEIFRVVTIGRLITIKRPMSVLHAFQRTGDQASELVFIGEGNLRGLLIAESEKLGLYKRAQITGLIKREAVYEHLAKADLFVSASSVEGLPVSVLEAMASRCPVILSDIPPHREIASGADFIPLIHPDDIEGMAREIERFRQMSSSERAEIGEKCRKIVEERFGLSTMHRRYEEIYAQVMAKY